MAFESSVPAVQPVWPYRVTYPGGFNNRRSRENFREFADPSRASMAPGASQGDAADGPNGITPLGQQETGGTASDFFDLVDGVPCSRTVTAPRGIGWTFPWWQPRFDASALPGGVRVPDGSVCAVLDAYLRVEWAIGGPADMVGVWIGGSLDSSSGAVYRAQTPGGASPGLNTGGAGFLLRVDGTGYDYVAWGVGGAVTERVPVPLTQTEWNVFRLVLVSAGPLGQFAQLRTSVNGTELLTRNYGTAALPVPFAAGGGAVGSPVSPALVFSANAITPPSGYAYAFDAKWGRFLPDGTELQAE